MAFLWRSNPDRDFANAKARDAIYMGPTAPFRGALPKVLMDDYFAAIMMENFFDSIRILRASF